MDCMGILEGIDVNLDVSHEIDVETSNQPQDPDHPSAKGSLKCQMNTQLSLFFILTPKKFAHVHTFESYAKRNKQAKAIMSFNPCRSEPSSTLHH